MTKHKYTDLFPSPRAGGTFTNVLTNQLVHEAQSPYAQMAALSDYYEDNALVATRISDLISEDLDPANLLPLDGTVFITHAGEVLRFHITDGGITMDKTSSSGRETVTLGEYTNPNPDDSSAVTYVIYPDAVDSVQMRQQATLSEAIDAAVMSQAALSEDLSYTITALKNGSDPTALVSYLSSQGQSDAAPLLASAIAGNAGNPATAFQAVLQVMSDGLESVATADIETTDSGTVVDGFEETYFVNATQSFWAVGAFTKYVPVAAAAVVAVVCAVFHVAAAIIVAIAGAVYTVASAVIDALADYPDAQQSDDMDTLYGVQDNGSVLISTMPPPSGIWSTPWCHLALNRSADRVYQYALAFRFISPLEVESSGFSWVDDGGNTHIYTQGVLKMIHADRSDWASADYSYYNPDTGTSGAWQRLSPATRDVYTRRALQAYLRTITRMAARQQFMPDYDNSSANAAKHSTSYYNMGYAYSLFLQLTAMQANDMLRSSDSLDMLSNVDSGDFVMGIGPLRISTSAFYDLASAMYSSNFSEGDVDQGLYESDALIIDAMKRSTAAMSLVADHFKYFTSVFGALTNEGQFVSYEDAILDPNVTATYPLSYSAQFWKWVPRYIPPTTSIRGYQTTLAVIAAATTAIVAATVTVKVKLWKWKRAKMLKAMVRLQKAENEFRANPTIDTANKLRSARFWTSFTLGSRSPNAVAVSSTEPAQVAATPLHGFDDLYTLIKGNQV